MTNEIALAATGRSKCRACRKSIAKGELRFGEQVANAFGEGNATYWFHLPCAAARRPEPFLVALQVYGDVAGGAELKQLAELGVQYPRLAEIVGVERSPTARARCRACRELIEKDALRLVLERLQDGMPSASGFVHASCASRYLRAENTEEAGEAPPPSRLVERLEQLPSALTEADFAELAALLS